jgi:formylglycine-generating enzyme required for sulfatase activity
VQTAAETKGLRENSLGMKFKPVAGTRVLFSVWETRVQDYAAYAAANTNTDRNWKDPIWEGTPVTPAPTHPAVNVSWFDAKSFCQWLTEKERKEGRLGADEEYRLPTDAEWSWAAGIGKREGNGTPDDKNGRLQDVYPWGRQWPPPNDAGNYDDYSEFRIAGFHDGFPRTAPVGNFPPNAQGLYDMGGNVWEWCEDWYDDGQKKRVLRGGSWINHVQSFLMSAYRDRVAPGTRYDCYGFRVVLATSATR